MTLQECAKFRGSNRLPALAYFDQFYGTSIWRCAQNKPGIFGRSSKDDEEMVLAIG